MIETAPPSASRSWVYTLSRELLQIVVPAILLALVIHLFLAQATIVYGHSMEPNLHSLERLLIEKVSYHLYPPQRNDIVVLDLPGMDELLIKRVVGLPGETVEIRQGILFINGIPLQESFEHVLSTDTLSPVTVPPLSYYVLGDNRSNSNDSRVFGPVRRETIIGRAWLRYWPLFHFTRF